MIRLETDFGYWDNPTVRNYSARLYVVRDDGNGGEYNDWQSADGRPLNIGIYNSCSDMDITVVFDGKTFILPRQTDISLTGFWAGSYYYFATDEPLSGSPCLSGYMSIPKVWGFDLSKQVEPLLPLILGVPLGFLFCYGIMRAIT